MDKLYDITRILNSNSWKESVLTTLIIKDPKTKKKRPEYTVLVQTVIKYMWFFYVLDKVNYHKSQIEQTQNKGHSIELLKWQLRLKVFVRDTIQPFQLDNFLEVIQQDGFEQNEEAMELLSTYYYDFFEFDPSPTDEDEEKSPNAQSKHHSFIKSRVQLSHQSLYSHLKSTLNTEPFMNLFSLYRQDYSTITQVLARLKAQRTFSK